MEKLGDTSKLIADLQHDETVIRRNLLISNVNGKMKDTLALAPIDEYLLGKNLEEAVKSAKALQDAGKELKKPMKITPAAKVPKNGKNPPRSYHQDRNIATGGRKQGSSTFQRRSPTIPAEFPEKSSPEGQEIASSSSLKSPVSKIAGRLSNFKLYWEGITNDVTILSWIDGYKIPFNSFPVQVDIPAQAILSQVEIEKTTDLINKLIDKDAVQKCSPKIDQFISPTFIVPKPDGTYRFILNLKQLNKFIVPVHFKHEDGRTASKLMFKDCYMATLDIKDAYYLVPIVKEHRKFLRFYCNQDLYEFTCLPFGLCTAPYVFTKLMKPVV